MISVLPLLFYRRFMGCAGCCDDYITDIGTSMKTGREFTVASSYTFRFFFRERDHAKDPTSLLPRGRSHLKTKLN